MNVCFKLIDKLFVSFPFQAKAARLSRVEEIRTVLNGSVCGMLSTFSQVS